MNPDERKLLERCEQGDPQAIMDYLATPHRPDVVVLFKTIFGYSIQAHYSRASGATYDTCSLSCKPKLSWEPTDGHDRVLWTESSGKPYLFPTDAELMNPDRVITDSYYIIRNGKVLEYDERRAVEGSI